jgi:hypothetical protein
MTITIIADAGSATANAYVTEVEQIAYMATRLNATAWTTVSGTTCTENEKKAMIEAAIELDGERWRGTRATDTQALAWPRWNVNNPDSPNQLLYDSTVVPSRVKKAAMELAFQFLNAGTTDVASLPATDGVIQKSVDVLSTTYAQPWDRPKGLKRFPRIWAAIRPLCYGSSLSVATVRG